MEAVRSDIKAPMYIDLKTVCRADGLRLFQDIALSSFCRSSDGVSSLSGEQASMTLTSRVLVGR